MKCEFMECETCRRKPGSPLLCEGCIHNRDVINILKAKIRRTELAAEIWRLDLEIAKAEEEPCKS